MELVDTHAHLEDIDDLDEALERAEEVGVVAVVTMGSDYESNLWTLMESIRHPTKKLRIYPALGLHPWSLDLSKIDATVQLIQENIEKATAIGEIGLDYWCREVRKSSEKKEQQRELFQRLLEIAKRNRKPVSIHSRGAWADCVDMAIESSVEKAVFHWFSGPLNVLETLLEHGYYVSATPAAAYSREHRDAVKSTPLDRLVLETDSTVPYQGKPSEPAHLLKTLSAVAELKGEKQETVAEQTTKNARSIFRL